MGRRTRDEPDVAEDGVGGGKRARSMGTGYPVDSFKSESEVKPMGGSTGTSTVTPSSGSAKKLPATAAKKNVGTAIGSKATTPVRARAEEEAAGRGMEGVRRPGKRSSKDSHQEDEHIRLGDLSGSRSSVNSPYSASAGEPWKSGCAQCTSQYLHELRQ
jgi:hypothetical protein